jgi:hypothetical protein
MKGVNNVKPGIQLHPFIPEHLVEAQSPLNQPLNQCGLYIDHGDVNRHH